MLKNIKGKIITDLIITGDVDIDDEVLDFLSDFTLILLQLEDKYLVFESVEQFSKISISETSELYFHKIVEEGYKKAYISLMNLLVINGKLSDVSVDKIILFNCEHNPENILCEAVKIVLSNGQFFFLDPYNFWGFTIGDDLQEKNWFESMRNKGSFSCKTTTIE